MKTRFTLLLNLLFLTTSALTALANPMLLPPPSVPTSVAATAVSTTQINLTWAAPTSANQTSYQIEYATDAGFSSPTPVIPDPGATATSQAIPGLTANTVYYVRIRAVNVDGPSAYVAVQATTQPGPPTLNAPTSVTNTSASLTWSAPAGSGAITNYELQTNGGAYVGIGTSQPYVAALNGNTGYTFTLRAVNSGGTSAPSGSVGTTTLPNQPGAIAFSDITNNSITLTWAAGAGGTDSYTLQIDGGAAIPVTSPYVAGGLSSNTNHSFSLVAVNGTGSSTARTGSQITRPDAPTGLVASSPTTNSLSLAWTAPGGGGPLTNYELSTNGGGGSLINQTSSPYSVGGLSANTPYVFT
ncbi:MAG: fibronectin type III domain-containing protein, partial [Sphingobacteriaceae bacterium]|nr:fibronectin type III domain-containing protein [Cytophagaceae bacterium]